MHRKLESTRRQPWLRPEFVRAMLAGHSALGLAFAALIYVVCLTGTLAVFLHEFRRWEQPGAPRVLMAPEADVIARALQNAYEKAKGSSAHPDIFAAWNGFLTPHFSVSFRDHESGAKGDWLLDSRGGIVANVAAPWSEFLSTLHARLHLPGSWGLFLVGLTGVALLSSLFSGVLSHPRIFKDAFALRRGGSRRLQEADLHNRLGVWGLPFHIAVSLTGAMLGLSVLIVGILALAAYDGDSGKAFSEVLGPGAGADETSAPLPNVVRMIADVKARHPDAVFANISIEHAGTAGQVVHLAMTRPGHLAFANVYYFSGDGTPLGDGGLETGSAGQQILGALQSLHFGWFGGLPIKLAYGLLGLALTVVTHSGITIWLARRRDNGRPADTWERLWSALAWGQPLALAATAGLSLLDADAPLLLFYVLLTVGTLLAGGFMRNAADVTRILISASSVFLSANVIIQVALHGVIPNDGMAMAVNAAIILTIVTLNWRVFTRRYPAPQ